jgi:hypothetical protein
MIRRLLVRTWFPMLCLTAISLLIGVHWYKRVTQKPRVITRYRLRLATAMCNDYRHKMGKVPDQVAWSRGVILHITNGRDFLAGDVRSLLDCLYDGWGHPLHYRSPSTRYRDSFDIYSDGPNGLDECGNGDDIVNWDVTDHDDTQTSQEGARGLKMMPSRNQEAGGGWEREEKNGMPPSNRGRER